MGLKNIRAPQDWPSDRERALSALKSLDAGCGRAEWHEIGRAAIASGLTIEDIDEWSSTAPNYQNFKDVQAAFKKIKPEGGTGPGTLFGLAIKRGWLDPVAAVRASHQIRTPFSAQPTAVTKAELCWQSFAPVTPSHEYVRSKRATLVPLDGLRVVPDDHSLRISEESMAGALAVPYLDTDGTVASIQFILCGEVAARRKSNGKPTKLNLPGHSLSGWFTVGEVTKGCSIYICEGIGTAWTCWLATGSPAVVCFGWGRVLEVAQALRKEDSSAKLVVCPDRGKEGAAAEIARKISGLVATMPEAWPSNADLNDLQGRDGLEVVERLLANAKAPDPRPLDSRLSFVFADAVAGTFTPPDELIEGVLPTKGMTVIYGDSNSGKTFLAVDLCCAVARGVPWMGRQTEQGLVVYLAAEGPDSIKTRLHAYQEHHAVRVPGFVIVQSPIDLFGSDDDAQEVVRLVRQLEEREDRKCRLIVGDTLARLTAGGNENAGQDMGKVIARLDEIRETCGVNFVLVHHAGKVAAQGARGWSGLRAAADTEIVINDEPQGRCAEVTKQRDLSTKGERIGFRLEQVQLGQTKWGKPASSCVVLPAAAPLKTQARRSSQVSGAIMEYVNEQGRGLRKGDLVKHFEGRYDRASVYRELKKLESAGGVNVVDGIVTSKRVSELSDANRCR